MSEAKNAIITAATITAEDHGVLSAWITLDYGGSGQGFGGYALYLPKSFENHTLLSTAGHFIWRVLEVAGVSTWEQVRGKTLRVIGDHSGIRAIGHIVKDDWFFPALDFGSDKASEAEAAPAQTPKAQQQPDPTPGQRWAEANVVAPEGSSRMIRLLHPDGRALGYFLDPANHPGCIPHVAAMRSLIAAIYDHAQREAAPVWRDAATEKPPIGKLVVVRWTSAWTALATCDGEKWDGVHPYSAARYWMEIPPPLT